jgi:hypothetical protein
MPRRPTSKFPLRAAAGAFPLMDVPSSTPPTPPYSVPPTIDTAATVGAPPNAPNPSSGTDTDNTSAAAEPSSSRRARRCTQASLPRRSPARRDHGQEEGIRAQKRPSPAAGANHPAPKKGKVSATRRMEQPPPPALSADPSGAHMVFDEMPER